MDEFVVLNIRKKKLWYKYFNHLPYHQKDFLRPEYYSLFENKFTKAECFVFNKKYNFISILKNKSN